MAHALRWLLIFALGLAVQTALVPVVSVAGIGPDIVLLIFFWFCLKYGMIPGIFVGFVLGLGQDLYSPAILGQTALAKTLCGFFIGLFNVRTVRIDPVTRIVLLFVGFLVHDAIFGCVELVSNATSIASLFWILLVKTMPRALYSAVIVAVVFAWQYFTKPQLLRE